MKKAILYFSSVILLLAGCQDAIIDPASGADDNPPVFNFSENDVVSGFMRIKLKEEPEGRVQGWVSGEGSTTGIRALDRSSSLLGITRMERTFPHAGKFEERSRREGMHLWYNVWFSEEVSATRAAGEVSLLEGIEIASPVLKVVSTAMPTETVWDTEVAGYFARASSFPFNDPMLGEQWGFNNPGTESWQEKGADIRVFDVWHQYSGHPDIIVSIVDGGIEPNHPDLQANLWVNPGETAGNGTDDDGNGYIDDVYGYNFLRNNGEIKGHRHGTHVAGTIGAVNNNDVGVCGIAGGDGTPNSGVKLMSCQIFEHAGGGDAVAENIGAAIKYGADNGAVISQNSWGYAADTRSSYIEPAHKAAIDYFVKYAGCDNDGNQLPGSPMKGGIVLFAAGNSNTSSERVAAPADYEKVLGIASIGPDYKKPVYSNYGTYIDISAPGGTPAHQIKSTTIKSSGYYENRYGTSMACPHVAGVAALVIEKHGVGKPGFTAAQLEEILLTSAYDVDKYNPEYEGQLGYGCVDAASALQADEAMKVPFMLETPTVSDGKLSFRANKDLSGEALLTFYNGTGNKVYMKNITVRPFMLTSVDVSGLSSGYYMFEYKCGEGKIEGKFIKY